ncbi:MAG: Guanylate kinase [Firmicutes bacterium]|nr:Guanylate kinase [Bacillota bacterium]
MEGKKAMQQQGNLIVISGPSATGKGTICKELLKQYTDISYSVSATTRAPRQGEVNGVNYWFTSKDEFKNMISNGKLLEWAEVYGNYYGTPIERVKASLALGKDIILEIDTQGAMQVKKNFPQGIFIYIVPPSLEALVERIYKRGTDSTESIECRLNSAAEEIMNAINYNYIVVNDIVASAVDKVLSIIKAERCNVLRNKALIKNISRSKGDLK